MVDEAKQTSLGCYRASFTLQHSLSCHAIQPLLHSYRVTIGVQQRLYWLIRVLQAQQNTRKTALKISIINFYFVTAFYSLYDICMADKKTFFRQEDMKNMFLDKKT